MPSSPSRSSAPETTTTSTGRAASLPLSRSRSLGRWQHAGEVALESVHFKVAELRCGHCGRLGVRRELLEVLQSLRAKAGPTRLNSAYRCPQHPSEARKPSFDRRSRVLQQLPGRLPRKTELPRRLPPTHSVPLHRPADHRTHFHLGHLQDVATHSAPVLSVQPIGRGLFPWPSPTAIKRRHAAHPCTCLLYTSRCV